MPASSISRRELLAGAGAGAAALLLDQRGVQAQPTPSKTVVFSHTTVVTVDAVQDDVALAVEGDRIAAIGPTDTILKTYPQRRGLRRTRQGAVPGPHQLSRASRGDPRARFQRGLRIPQLRAPGRPAQQSPSGRRGDADGHRRCAGGDTDRDHDDRGELRRHQPPRRRVGADRPALRVRGVGPRQRERGRPDVAGRARQE